MATIVDFKPLSCIRKSAEMPTGCEIIIFPGVRYERWETAPPPSADSAARKKRQKKQPAELAD